MLPSVRDSYNFRASSPFVCWKQVFLRVETGSYTGMSAPEDAGGEVGGGERERDRAGDRSAGGRVETADHAAVGAENRAGGYLPPALSSVQEEPGGCLLPAATRQQ